MVSFFYGGNKMNCTKKQLVDFIDSRCVFDDGRAPKSVLNKCPKEALMKIIESETKIEKAFYEYVQKDNESKRSVASVKVENKACEENSTENAEKDLRDLVDKLIEAPNSLLETMNFKSFIANLPYGSVSDNVLKEMVDKLMDVNLGMAMVLFEYQVKQTGRG